LSKKTDFIIQQRGGKAMSEKGHNVSRRQFLNYTLTGVGGFMAAGMIMPMVRFAVDPVLKKGTDSALVQTKLKAEDITNEPQSIKFTVDQVDGWYESKVQMAAWVYKDEAGKIVALSPVCKHLGCTVNWNGDPANQNQFFCPCHNGRYTKDGDNVPGTPPLGPLDVYEHEVRDGWLYLGKAKPQA
jgi:menaquinol-cytochrome c reductase iron-sulfur subunit